MAAVAAGSSEAPVRLRLLFDYPPPGSPACGLCWLLLEPSQVRLVTDLISLIRDKFGFSRRAKLSLFLEGALLPPTESARLVRDNDSLRVKLEEVIGGDCYDKTANGFSHLSKKERKRHRQKLEAEESNSEEEEHRKRKKSKWFSENVSSQEENTTNVQDPKKLKKREKVVVERNCIIDSKSHADASHSKKLKKRADQEKEQEAGKAKKKQKARTLETKKTNKASPLSCSQKSTAKNSTAQSSTKKGGTSSSSSISSSDSDHNEKDLKQKLSHKAKVTAQHTHKQQLSSPVKPTSASKLASKPNSGKSPRTASSKKAESQSSSSDSESSSGEEQQQSSNLKNKLLSDSQRPVTCLTSKTKPSSSESDSSETDTCTVKNPKTNAAFSQSLRGKDGKQLPAATCELTTSPSNAAGGRGRGGNVFWRGPRVRGCRGMVRGRGRGRGESTDFSFNYNGEHQKEQQLNEVATNTSVIVQNPLEAPKKDYSTLPLLAAPPQVGEKIAFKLLELTENYTPEVSDYKEGRIVSWNPSSKQLELEILSFSSVAKEPGKFDLVYQSADGAETIEYAVSQDRKITESWNALIEPRLIVDPPNVESSNENGNP